MLATDFMFCGIEVISTWVQSTAPSEYYEVDELHKLDTRKAYFKLG